MRANITGRRVMTADSSALRDDRPILQARCVIAGEMRAEMCGARQRFYGFVTGVFI
jgi:hypothetical protein